MAEKILASIVIDEEALDAVQAKADKVLATLKEAAELSDRLTAKEKPPKSGKMSDEEFRRMLAEAIKLGYVSDALAVYTKSDPERVADKLCELFDKHLRRIAQATSQPQ